MRLVIFLILGALLACTPQPREIMADLSAANRLIRQAQFTQYQNLRRSLEKCRKTNPHPDLRRRIQSIEDHWEHVATGLSSLEKAGDKTTCRQAFGRFRDDLVRRFPRLSGDTLYRQLLLVEPKVSGFRLEDQKIIYTARLLQLNQAALDELGLFCCLY